MSTPDIFLPTLFQIVKKTYVKGAISASGNEKDTWGPPTEFDVYGWGPPESKKQFTEPKQVFEDNQRFMVALEIMVPPGFRSKSRDRFYLCTLEEYQADPDAIETYRQIGPLERYDANPFGWNPGSVVNLVAAEGAP